MDYEDLYRVIQPLEKAMKDKLAGAQKAYRSLCKNAEKGELKNISKDLTLMKACINDYDDTATEYARVINNFDPKAYIESGDFARQLLLYCDDLSVDIKGDFPTYDMFPYKVRIDSENQELYIDRKKSLCLRPQYFVNMIKQNQDKLYKASFNIGSFLNELAKAYDIALLQKERNAKAGKSGKPAKNEHDIFLKDLYSIMVPMQRFRKEYDLQSYAFDLTRLYNSNVTLVSEGRSFEFASSRKADKLIRILDKNGKEQYLATIRFYQTV